MTKNNIITFKEARGYARKLGLKSKKEWFEYCKTPKRPKWLNTLPTRKYKKEWVSWMDWLNTNNKRPEERKYKVNDDFFKTWSSNMAYILGFWFADGCLFNRNIIFSQHKKDKYLLYKIANEMGADNPIITNGKYSRLVISSQTLSEDLVKLGGKERKSLDVDFPKIPKEFLPDFIRGLWDGDGCISFNKRSKAYTSCYVGGSVDFVNGLFNELRRLIPEISGNITTSKNKGCESVYYRIRFSRNDTIRMKNFLYYRGFNRKLTLTRKYKKFLDCGDFFTYEFISYKDAKEFALKMKIKNNKEWRKLKKPVNIPSRPDSVYKNKGWEGWRIFLGNNKNEQ